MGVMLHDEQEMSAWIMGEGLTDVDLMEQMEKSGEIYYIAKPQKYIIKSIIRHFLIFFLIVFTSTYSILGAFNLPIYGICVYRYNLFVRVMKSYNVSSYKLWLVLGIWCIICIPVCIQVWKLILV